MSKPFYEVVQDESNKWHWRLWSANGRAICQSVDGFGKRKACIEGIRNHKKVTSEANDIACTYPDDEEEVIGKETVQTVQEEEVAVEKEPDPAEFPK
jgi:uncharacterized protein YegP (UPF0339 family)